VAVFALALVMVAGMAYDGGQILAARATGRDVAANAARAGAQEIDLTMLRRTGRTTLDPGRATAAAQAYLAKAGVEGRVTVNARSVTVAVTMRQAMRILPLPARLLVVAQTATAITGVEAGNGR
jgi:hypothetical protein